MKPKWVIGFLLLMIPGLAVAKNSYREGKIVSMSSAPCAQSQKDLCHEYVIHSEGMEYRVLDQKGSQVLLQVGQKVGFQMQKDRMKVRAVDEEGKGRQRELRVVGVSSIEGNQAAAGSENDEVCGGLRKADARSCQDGYRLGKKDATKGLSRNYQRHDDDFDSNSEQAFRRGYRAGWSEANKND